MSKLLITDIHAIIVDANTIVEPEMLLSYWMIEYKIYHNNGHFWRGFLKWEKRDCIINDVLAKIRKDLPKYTENENNSK
jgi:hypothetical protein